MSYSISEHRQLAAIYGSALEEALRPIAHSLDDITKALRLKGEIVADKYQCKNCGHVEGSGRSTLS